MGNKEDWEELEQWAQKDKQDKIDNYKFDISNTNELQSRRKKMDKVFNPINKTLESTKKVFIILASIVGILAFIIFVGWLSSVKTFVNADIHSMLDFYGVETQILSQDVDKKR